MKTKEQPDKNPSTEEQIKDAARLVFTQKGYAATRTRDIAEASGVNLALINYYFRSKEKLFDIIMMEHIKTFSESVLIILDDPKTTLHEKLQTVVSHYIDMLTGNPNLPLFILNEVNTNPAKLMEKIGIDKDRPGSLYISKQLMELNATKGLPAFNPIHILINFVGLTIFPFVSGPLIRNRTGLSMEAFNALMEERKKLIPIWMKAIMASVTAE